MIPYGKQCIDDDDIQAVVDVLRSDWITTGPLIDQFEKVFSDFVGAKYAVAVSNGTAALHAAMYALGIGLGDKVIVSPITFAASANSVIFQGGTPIFADVDSNTLLLDPDQVEAKITRKTKAILAVDYAGQPCDYDALKAIADFHGIALIADACHALGGRYKGRPVGSLADLSAFSFHPVKHITTGEGGMITTDNLDFAKRMQIFRNHGITSNHRERDEQGSWFYEMVDLGYNYRLTDFQCALGINQLNKLPGWIDKRQKIAKIYSDRIADIPGIEPLVVRPDVSHAYHLYVIRIDEDKFGRNRQEVFRALREMGIGVNVHYIPVHLHPFYRTKFSTGPGLCPVAEDAYRKIISLPIYPGLNDIDHDKIIKALKNIARGEN